MEHSKPPGSAVNGRSKDDGWIGYYLNQLAARVRNATSAALQPHGLSPAQFRVLQVVSAHQPISQVKLGELTGTDRTTIVAIVDRLEAIGAVERKRDEADRRSHALVTTQQGESLLPQARALVQSAEDTLLASLDAMERTTLRALLIKLHQTPVTCPQEKEQ